MSDYPRRLRFLNDVLLMTGQDDSDTLLDSANEIERLRSALETILTVPVGEGAAASMSKIALQALRVREALDNE